MILTRLFENWHGMISIWKPDRLFRCCDCGGLRPWSDLESAGNDHCPSLYRTTKHDLEVFYSNVCTYFLIIIHANN